jgi:hypothetical protein
MTDDQMGNAKCETKSGDSSDDATASQTTGAKKQVSKDS